MKQMTIFSLAILVAATAISKPGEAPQIDIPFPTNAVPESAQPLRTISVQEMLQSGPPELKMHSLSLIASGTLRHPIDDSFLPGLKACASDPMPPVRSVTAKVLGKYFVEGKDKPNPEVIKLLTKLAKDPTPDVRYNAVYYGLCSIQNKSDDVVSLLIEIGASDRKPTLIERITQSLEGNKEQVARILDQKLASSNNAAYFEIYEDYTGSPPANLDKYLDLPSSRPRLFIFAKAGTDAEKDKAELIEELKAVGIAAPSVAISKVGGDNYVLMVKTYIIKEGMAVEKNFSDKGKFKIIQQMWLTPELEVQMDALQAQ